MKNFVKPLCLIIATFMTGACVSVLPKTSPPAPRYTIAAITNDNITAAVNWSLIVADPTSSQLYNTTKVALTREENRFEFYSNTEWVDRAPVLFQRALVRSFENSGHILNIGDSSTLPVSDYILKTDMRAFHVDYTNVSPSVEVMIYARLVDKNGSIRAVRNFSAQQFVEQDSISAVMAGFDITLDQVLSEIVSWGFFEGESILDGEVSTP